LKENENKDLSKRINELIAEHRKQLIRNEDTYITSRYEVAKYHDEDLKSLIEVVEKIIINKIES
jgi:HEPN domain-containing protein